MRTATPGTPAASTRCRTSLNREGNFFHGKVGYLRIGEGFDDDLGYYRRTGAQKWLTRRGDPPAAGVARSGAGSANSIRTCVWNYYTDISGQRSARTFITAFTFFLNYGAFIEPAVNRGADASRQPLARHPDAPPVRPAGSSWTDTSSGTAATPAGPVSFDSRSDVGGLWSGTSAP